MPSIFNIIELLVDEFSLQPNTHYTVFIRGVTEDGNHQSTLWYTPVRLAAEDETGKEIYFVKLDYINLTKNICRL